MLMALGGFVGELLVPNDPSAFERAFPPSLGGVLGFFIGVLLLFLFFTNVSYARQGLAAMVTNVVTQVNAQQNSTVVAPYPIVMSNPTTGAEALQGLLNRGKQLESSYVNSNLGRRDNIFGERTFSSMDTWLQEWLNELQSGVWAILPRQAQYILSDARFDIAHEAQRYVGWDARLASRRVVLDKRLGRLREICSQIPEFHTADSETGEAE